MNDTETTALASARRSVKFNWDKVSKPVALGMLRYVYESAGRDDDVAALTKMNTAQVRQQARRVFDEPPKARHFDAGMCDWLRRHWLPTADEGVVRDLTLTVQAGLAGNDRRRKFRTTSGRVRFLLERRLTDNFRTNLRKAFLSAHRGPGEPRHPGDADERSPRSWIRLRGDGEPEREPFQHQLDAWASMDASPTPLRGVLVLPTGAGKTDTAALWLLRQMASEPELRVLWVAHQQELVDQALLRFQGLSATMDDGFERRARVIHAAGSSTSTLADAALDLAGITIQSLGRLLDTSPAAFSKFLSRPTYVVVDEAHHAGSPTYTTVLQKLCGRTTCRGVIGLTATPYPTDAGARARFDKFFPSRLLEVRREDLVAREILARPQLHIIDTGTRVILSGTERDQAVANDLPSSALNKVVGADRDSLLVRTWQKKPSTWGKTLVFATGIEHADAIRDRFVEASVDCRSLHSRSAESSGSVLAWFRKNPNPCVLVSVGMLTEGVDLPDARTAFLARPTTSRIVMQQMIGRVLRGPKAHGDPEAHLVYFRDRWQNFGDVIEPPEIIPVERERQRGEPPELPPIVLDDEAREIPPEVAATVERLLDQARRSAVLDDDDPDNDRSLDPQLTASLLVGYYDLDGFVIPVFEHQRQGYEDLLREADWSLQGYGLLHYFDGEPPPFPTRRALRLLVQHVREFGPPPFIELRAEVGPERAARAVVDSGPITSESRRTLIRNYYETSINGSASPSFAHFEEQVDAEIRKLLAAANSLEAERPLSFAPKGERKLPRRARPLRPIVDHALATAYEILEAEHANRLDSPPPVYWTRRVNRTTWAHWTIALGKRGAGRQQIRVNRILRTDPKAFPDEALAYLVYHELLHHLLPGQGHDAEFRRLEQLWPKADELDLLFATMHETWDTDPARYANDVGGPRDVE